MVVKNHQPSDKKTRFPGLVPKLGVEPRWPFGHCALNAARLPVPPLRHESLYFIGKSGFVNYLCVGKPNRREVSLTNFIVRMTYEMQSLSRPWKIAGGNQPTFFQA
jgi:hypothetical protein